MDLPNENFNFISFILNGLSNGLNNEINNGAMNRETENNEPKKASREFIDSLQEIEIKEEGPTCSICLEDFKIGDKCIELPCKDHKHLFHSEKEGCMGIKKWLEKSNTCPVCRTEFPEETNTIEVEQENIEQDEVEIDLREIDDRMRQLMGNILNNNIRVLSPQEIIEMEEQRQLEAAIQASLEEQ